VLKGLYVITDERLTPYENGKIFTMVELALKGGARIVQLRDKHSSEDVILEVGKRLKELCNAYGATFILNDRLELCEVLGADGVHLGKDDFDFKKARGLLKNKVLGVSCYGDIERAVEAEKIGADYVAFGSFFPSPTKPEAKVIPISVIPEAKKRLKIPVCAIGGITLERAKKLINLGVDMIAVISDIWKAEDIEARARAYSKLFNLSPNALASAK